MQDEQIRTLNDKPIRRGRYVLYWMQRSQRQEGNLALEYAIRKANEHDLPVLAAFCLAERYPDANERHFAFMLEGLAEAVAGCAGRGVGFALMRGSPPDPILQLSRAASVVVCDRGYLRHLRKWREDLAHQCVVRVVEVEDNAVVPVDLVSSKREYAARTIRPKIHRHLDRFLSLPEKGAVKVAWTPIDGIETVESIDAAGLLNELSVDREARAVAHFKGGRREALRRLDAFVMERLSGYADDRSDPSLGATSTLSPYLHFGQIAPLEIVRAVLDSDRGRQEDRDALVEELVVRRELSMNFVVNEPAYDAYESLPSWARNTLEGHRKDKREYVYSVDQLEASETHDPYWNAAMDEMKKTGFMHNYMRMYWGKKVLEWTDNPEDAFYATLYLNNKYFLDGRDPNSYAGVGWIFGLHDRPWTERPIFGTVRYMNANGLRRKFDIERYVEKIARL